ncbi:MAG: chorismate synthase [Lentimicrobiaceae bacterium]|jgi:chorismate synthase|nr:chorismate synthase [Lentimicrobiaceae bacterium]MCP4909068.1 chorismate synthase [Bacteroidota bacterium]MBT4060898.1 chorismate synthase [Lentimicrobiaceae bacterium]MBT4191282.1 chorismate synthase [Lentimicrobiaceae bacterium]MBT5162513.1 chorismate synthase [Lentimicrobiaceae bacterium]
MAGNIFGRNLTLTTFGESHGKAIGGILDGLPAGLGIDFDFINGELARRRPGQSKLVSSRNEPDQVEFLSGLKDGISLGTPIAFMVRNKDFRPEDYKSIENTYRPSHADYTWDAKYGIRDASGGGRSSARETLSRVVGGAIAKLFLNKVGITMTAFVNRIGSIYLQEEYSCYDLNSTENSEVRCPDNKTSEKMISLITETGEKGDTLGGEITCIIKNLPPGLGEPVFNKLNADLGHAILGINAVKGFDIGSGFKSSEMYGSELNDEFYFADGRIRTKTNNSGGIQGGISNGEDIYFRAAFKPVASIMLDQETVDKSGQKSIINPKGRHDVCVVPRAVPIVEAMAALVLADHLIQNSSSKLENFL